MLIIFVCLASPCFAGNILALKSADIKPFNDVLSGFKKTCGCSVKEVSISEIGKAGLAEAAASSKADAVLAIGMDALKEALSVSNMPVVHALVTANPDMLPDQKNISGVSMSISAARQIDAIKRTFPRVKRIGILYDPKNSARFVTDVKAAATEKGFELVLKAVQKTSDLILMVNDMKGSIDLFWMLPDANLLNADNVNHIFLFSFQNRVPVFTFSKKYVDQGAVAALVVDPADIGKQAGELMKRLLDANGERPNILQDVRSPLLIVNTRIAEKLNVHIHRDIKEVEDVSR